MVKVQKIMLDWRFIVSKHLIGRKLEFGHWWTWDTHLSDSEDFNDPLILRKGADFLDVGSCFGFWAVRASPYYQRVFALEPFPENYRILLKNIKMNHCQNIIPLQVAAGRKVGETHLFIYGKDAWGEPSLLREHMGHSATLSVRVGVTTLDFLVDRYGIKPSVIKLDVEGAETEVLQGSRMTIGVHRPDLIVEVHTPQDPRSIVQDYVWKERFRYLNPANWKDERQLHLYGRHG